MKEEEYKASRQAAGSETLEDKNKVSPLNKTLLLPINFRLERTISLRQHPPNRTKPTRSRSFHVPKLSDVYDFTAHQFCFLASHTKEHKSV